MSDQHILYRLWSSKGDIFDNLWSFKGEMIPPNHGAFVTTYVYFDYFFKIHKHFKVKWPSSKVLIQRKLKNVLDEEPDGTLSLDF